MHTLRKYLRTFASTLQDTFKTHLHTSVWPSKTRVVLENLQLDSLTIDFGVCMCTYGFCGIIDDALRSFVSGFANGMPKEVHALGFYNGFDGYLGQDAHDATVSDALREWTIEMEHGVQ